MIKFLVVSVVIFGAVCAEEVDFSCSDEVCKDVKCGTAPDDCNGIVMKSPTSCNCCPYCLEYLKEGDQCATGSPTDKPVTKICGPELTCNDNKVCSKKNNTFCTKNQKEYDMLRDQWAVSWRPQCDSEGDFAPIHCIPNSICYCIDPKTGERIFGERLYETSITGINCGCSVAAHYAQKELGEDTEFAHCLPDGQYDALQCIDDKCYCVDNENGTMTSMTMVFPEQLKKDALPCFDEAIHTPYQFERSCEIKRKMMKNEISYLLSEGITLLNVNLPKCTPDGQFYRVQADGNGGIVCVDPDGNPIEAYKADEEGSDCNCAMTKWLMKNAGSRELPDCAEDGSYRQYQCWRRKCFCVDKNGNQNSDDVEPNNYCKLECMKEQEECKKNTKNN